MTKITVLSYKYEDAWIAEAVGLEAVEPAEGETRSEAINNLKESIKEFLSEDEDESELSEILV